MPVSARQRGISRYMCVRRALLANTPYSYLERSSIQLLAYSLAHSCLPLADASLSRALPVEPSWALYLHIGTVSRSGESRKRGFIGPPAEGRDTICERERETGSCRSSSESSTGIVEIVTVVYLSSSYSFDFLRFRRPFLVSLLTSRTRDIYAG